MTSATHREVTTTESLMWDIHSSRVFWEDVQPADVVEREQHSGYVEHLGVA